MLAYALAGMARIGWFETAQNLAGAYADVCGRMLTYADVCWRMLWAAGL